MNYTGVQKGAKKLKSTHPYVISNKISARFEF